MFIKVAVLKQERFFFSRGVHFEILRLDIEYITDAGNLFIIVSL